MFFSHRILRRALVRRCRELASGKYRVSSTRETYQVGLSVLPCSLSVKPDSASPEAMFSGLALEAEPQNSPWRFQSVEKGCIKVARVVPAGCAPFKAASTISGARSV